MNHVHTPPDTRATVEDPVCHMKVNPGTARFRTDYQGTTYYFCSPGCKAKFEAHPEHYVSPQPAEPAPVSSTIATEYFCPMHPEVVRDKPGVCPKCGMALEPRASLAMGEEGAHERELRKRFLVSAACTVPVIVLSLLDFLPAFHELIPMRLSAALQGLLAAPVVLWGAVPFYRSALAGARERTTNMYTLITIGVIAAYGFSLLSVLFPNLIPRRGGMLAVYFDTAAVITTLILLGDWLQGLARGRTNQAIRQLAGMQAKHAHLLRDGQEIDVPLSSVRVGDLLRVKPGEIIPTDGTIIEGNAAADESMITGESLPVKKEPGNAVVGATVISGGSLVVRAERLGNDTLLGQIIRLVAEAQSSRAPAQRLADKIAAIFVPVVVLTAIVTFIVWTVWGPAPGVLHGLVNAVAVLIIACPCALGLATPLAITAAVGRGAQKGILIKSGEAIEKASQANVLVVDKTGTLTEGKPRVTEIAPATATTPDEILALAAAVEQLSEHPLAGAVVDAANERNLKVPRADGFETITGRGVRAKIDGALISVGSAAFIQETAKQTIASTPPRPDLASSTQIFVARDGQWIGTLFIADPPRQSALAAVRGLKTMGVNVVMASGDRKETAEAIAAQLGIDNVHAPVMPQDKVALVKDFQAKGQQVMFAGDGINDAPALAQADVGVAMATGTNIAMESAGMTILHGDLMRVLGAIRLSRAARRIIRQNLFWAFVYNTVGVPVAAGVLYPFFGLLLSPVIASVAMSLSSISVVFNSLRLRAVQLD